MKKKYINKLEKPFLDAINYQLKEKRLSVRKLADIVDIPYSTIHDYVKGNTKIPLHIYIKICNALDICVYVKPN